MPIRELQARMRLMSLADSALRMRASCATVEISSQDLGSLEIAADFSRTGEADSVRENSFVAFWLG
jgi:hypothetical protein